MRFLVTRIDPKSGKELLGTAPNNTYQDYASVENVIRYGLAKEAFPPGQYNIYFAPKDSNIERFVRTAYKRSV